MCAPLNFKMQEKHLKNNDYVFVDKIWPNWNDFKPLTLAKWHLTLIHTNTHTHKLLSKLWHGSFVMAHFLHSSSLFFLFFSAPLHDVFEWLPQFIVVHSLQISCAWIFIVNIFIALSWCHSMPFFVVKHFKWFFFWPLLNDLHKYPISHTHYTYTVRVL